MCCTVCEFFLDNLSTLYIFHHYCTIFITATYFELDFEDGNTNCYCHEVPH